MTEYIDQYDDAYDGTGGGTPPGGDTSYSDVYSDSYGVEGTLLSDSDSFTASESEVVLQGQNITDSDSVTFTESETVIEILAVVESSDSATATEIERLSKSGDTEGGFAADILREPYLVSLWRMDQLLGIVDDESGYGNHAQSTDLTAASPLISGDIVSSYFDGISSGVTVPFSNSYRFGRDTFTVEFWMDATADGTVIEHLGAWSIWVSDGSLYASIEDTKGTVISGIISDVAQTHFAVVFDRSIGAMYTYMNGEPVDHIVDMANIKTVNENSDITIGHGSHGFLTGRIGEMAIIASNVDESIVHQRYVNRSVVHDVDASIEYLEPYAYFIMEEGELLDTEVSTYTFDSLVVSETDRLSWHAEGSAAKIDGGGVSIDPFDVQTVEFVVSTTSLVPELVYQHTYDVGTPLSIQVVDDAVIIEEDGSSLSYPYDTDFVHVVVRIEGDTSTYFVNGVEQGSANVPSRGNVTGIRLFSLDANPDFIGTVDLVALYDYALAKPDVKHNFSLVNSGRNHFSFSDSSSVSFTDEGYSTMLHDWSVTSAS